jgi:predicted NodU family carbamoyl transferase
MLGKKASNGTRDFGRNVRVSKFSAPIMEVISMYYIFEMLNEMKKHRIFWTLILAAGIAVNILWNISLIGETVLGIYYSQFQATMDASGCACALGIAAAYINM